MRKMLLIPLIVCMVALLPTLWMPAAQASKQAASGSFYPTSPYPLYYEESLVGDNLIIKAGWPFAQTGTFSGTVLVEQTIIIELDSGNIEGEDVATFTGYISGESGSYTGFHEWTVVDGFAVGTWEIISGTVGLATLEGEGTFVTDFGTGLGTYSGYIEFND